MGVMVAKGVVAEMAGAAYRAEMRRVQRSSRTPPAALPTRLRLCKLVAAAAAVVAEGAVGGGGGQCECGVAMRRVAMRRVRMVPMSECECGECDAASGDEASAGGAGWWP